MTMRSADPPAATPRAGSWPPPASVSPACSTRAASPSSCRRRSACRARICALFDLPAAFDDGMIIGRGRLDGREVLVAAQEGQFMGGTFAEVSGAKLRRPAARRARPRPLARPAAARQRRRAAAGGQCRRARRRRGDAGDRRGAQRRRRGHRPGRRARRAPSAAPASPPAPARGSSISEQGRLGVTGPEVIETNKGVEEFDSKDKALVWSVTGGRTRRLIGGADAYAEDTVAGFREAALALLDRVAGLRPADAAAPSRHGSRRGRRGFGGCSSATEMWAILGIADPEASGTWTTRRSPHSPPR